MLKEITDNEGNTVYEYKEEKREQVISTEIASTISQILKEGVDGAGGAKNAYVAGYSIAAKTGTSEKKDKYDSSGNTSYRVSSCVAYAPSEDAQVAVIIIVDEPSVGSKYGSVVAAPYVSNLMELVLPYLGVKATFSEADKEHEQVRVPNLENVSVKEAIELLSKQELKYEIIGNGEIVTGQMPKEGGIIYKKTGKILIYTDGSIVVHNQVPNVVGKTPEEANKILANQGFNIRIEGATNFSIGQGAYVTAQYPMADTYYEKGGAVTITILYTDEKD